MKHLGAYVVMEDFHWYLKNLIFPEKWDISWKMRYFLENETFSEKWDISWKMRHFLKNETFHGQQFSMHLSQLVRDTAAFALEVTPPWHCALLSLWLKRLPEQGPPMSILLYIFFVLVSKIRNQCSLKVWWKFLIKYLQSGTGTRGLKYKFHFKY